MFYAEKFALIKKTLTGFFVLFTFNFFCNVISYKLSPGRFGDQILTYSKAQWLAYTYQLPLLYIPFKYSEFLMMHTEFANNNLTLEKSIPIISVSPTTQIFKNSTHSEIYEVSLSTKKDAITNLDSIYECMISDPVFENYLKKMLSPIISLPTIELPKTMITVALHVRKGGGFDQPLLSRQLKTDKPSQSAFAKKQYTQRYADTIWPHKFPPDQYYVDQLIFLSELLDDTPLYVYLFTDDPHPEILMDRYKKATNKPNITFDCRKEKNRHNLNVLDDFYAIAQFDCLIRAASNFSRAAQLLGNHTIIIFPRHAQWIGDMVFVDTIGIIIRNKEHNYWKKELIHPLKQDRSMIIKSLKDEIGLI